MTPEQIERVIGMVELFGAENWKCGVFHTSEKLIEEHGAAADKILAQIRAALTDEGDSPEIRKTLGRYMHLAADPYRDNEEQVWLERAYTELRRSNMLPDFLPVDRKPIPERRAALIAEIEGAE